MLVTGLGTWTRLEPGLRGRLHIRALLSCGPLVDPKQIVIKLKLNQTVKTSQRTLLKETEFASHECSYPLSTLPGTNFSDVHVDISDGLEVVAVAIKNQRPKDE